MSYSISTVGLLAMIQFETFCYKAENSLLPKYNGNFISLYNILHNIVIIFVTNYFGRKTMTDTTMRNP